MLLFRFGVWSSFVRATRSPDKVQKALLARILKINSKTKFGIRHHFEEIKTYEDYRNRVEVQSYEDLRPYIERQDANKEPELTLEQPVLYAKTSGTTAAPKLIPILAPSIDKFRESQKIASYAQYKDIPGIYSGKILAVVSPGVEGHTAAGTPYGSMSGLVYEEMPKVVRRKYVIPSAVFAIDDYELKYLTIATLGLMERNVTLLVSANPSTFIKLLSVINSNIDKILEALENGHNGDPVRAEQLRTLHTKRGKLNFADIWPGLKAVATWTGGSVALLIPKLKKALPTSTALVEMGYLASEFRGSITVDVINNRSVLAMHETFYEFVKSSDDNKRNFVTVDLLEEGEQYYVYITTSNGLYRYDMNDIVEVTGKFNNTPTIKFVQKGKGVTNITGEKLYESQVEQAIRGVEGETGAKLEFYIVLAYNTGCSSVSSGSLLASCLSMYGRKSS